jgi:hypothetical protein
MAKSKLAKFNDAVAAVEGVAVIYVECVEEYALVKAGKAIATAHRVGAVWSVKIGDRFAGIVPTAELAQARLGNYMKAV